jgi:acetyltransferase-like isoleucine patch superfamily enzyme
MIKLLGMLLTNPRMVYYFLMDKVRAYLISLKRNVVVQGKLVVNGKPMIDIFKECQLVIGDGVTLNSRNRGYHINMHSPVKLLADRPGAHIKIGDRTRIHGTCIHAYNSIEIGKNCLIAANCQIIDGNGHDLSFPDVDNRINTRGSSKPVKIEDSVWLGANVIVLPGVTIGKGSVISANSVVSKDIPPMALAAGNPAVVLKQYQEESLLNKG